MPNPTPQQRIEELVREFPNTEIGTLLSAITSKAEYSMLKEAIRQALKQAYLAGLEAMMDEIMKYDDGLTVSMSSDHPKTLLSQLKEQINK